MGPRFRRQWEPDKTEIGRRLLDSSYDLKYSPMSMKNGNCAVQSDPIPHHMWFDKFIVKLFALKQQKTHVVFPFHSCVGSHYKDFIQTFFYAY